MDQPGVWTGVLRRLEAELPRYAIDAWVRPLEPEPEPGGDGLRLLCPTPFHRDRVRGRLLAQIARCASEEAGRPVAVSVALGRGRRKDTTRCATPDARRPAPEREPRPAAGPSDGLSAGSSAGTLPDPSPPCVKCRHARPGAPGAPQDPGGPRGAQPRPGPAIQSPLPYSFETFVVGPCNALAQAASVEIARGAQRLSPLYLAAGAGLGKTHLARAVAAEAAGHGRRALYTSAEAFTNEFSAALRNKEMGAFKRRYRGCDVLVVEDIPFLRGKSATQLELFHTIDHLLDTGRRVVLTGSSLPREVDGIEPRLGGRMASGLVAEMEAPDARVRRQILRAKASAGGVRVPDDCLDLLVESIRGNVRDLESVLIQLVASAALLKRPVDRELTELALRKVSPPEPRGGAPLEPGTVVAVVSAFFQTTPASLASRSRRRDLLVPRQLAMYLCRRYTTASLPEIGRTFLRKHPSVANAIAVVERAILERAPLRYQVEALCARLDALSGRADPGDGI